MTPTREQVDAELKRLVVPEFRRLGFKGSYPHFYRDRAGHIDLATVQFISGGGKFVVELSYSDRERGNVYIYKDLPAAKLRASQTTKRFRLGATAPHNDHWFVCTDAKTELTALCASVNQLLSTQGSNWWLQQSDA
jgi:hypothetical protein